jgi:hypothetical protein
MALFGTAVNNQNWRAPRRSIPNFGARPVWISLWTWGYAGGASHNQGMVGFANTASNFSSIGPYVAGSGTILLAWDANDANAFQQANVGPRMLAATWQHILAVYASVSSRVLYVNGVYAGQDVNTLGGTQTLDTFVIGNINTNSATVLDTNRSVAEVAFGRGTLSNDQIQMLADGVSPLTVAPTQVLAYYPLRNDLNDYGPMRSGLVPINNPPTVWGEHPPVAPLYRRRPSFISTAATGGSATGTGTAAGTSTAAATGAALAAGVGSAAGTSTAAATGLALAPSIGSASGVGAANAVGRALVSSIAVAAGTSTALGVGASVTGASAIGSAIGTSTALAVGAFLGSTPRPRPRITMVA